MKILVVDDDKDVREVLIEIIEMDLGHDCVGESSGNRALEYLKSNSVDVLISDVRMPDGDGLELLQGMQKEEIKVDRIYMMTGFTDIQDQEFMKCGAQEICNKPLSLDKIREILG
jgi:DNA-binding NtrC family response regulator